MAGGSEPMDRAGSASGRGRAVTRALLGLGYFAAGTLHLLKPEPFIRITPGWVPAPALVIALTGLAARIARGLLRLQDSAGTITATHEVLAAEIGSGRAAVSRGLAALARAGVIELGRGHVQVRDPVRLAGFAHEPD